MDGTGNARQQHGLDFEKWIKTTFFQSYTQTGPTDKWDALNVLIKSKYSKYAGGFQGLPVSLKTCKEGSPIGFGDALRQYKNVEDFFLIVGFWQRAGVKRKYVCVKGVKIANKQWRKLFEGSVSEDELKNDRLKPKEVESRIMKLDRTIKTTPFYKDARRLAREQKEELPEMDIVLNPKIDSKNQRRLQCSLPNQIFWKLFAGSPPSRQEKCTFWGEEVPPLD